MNHDRNEASTTIGAARKGWMCDRSDFAVQLQQFFIQGVGKRKTSMRCWHGKLVVILLDNYGHAGMFDIIDITLTPDNWMSDHTPLKINMEHNDGGLEDHFPF